ncbi:MAG: metallophosphoesterase [bacterium]|nr:metallophosphoesterase [Candidatus Colisoma equi]
MNPMNRREFLKSGLAASAVSVVDWRLLAAEEGVPSYYGDYLAKIAARVGSLAKTCADGFWFITDLHVSANGLKSGPLLTRLVRTTPLRKVLSGGDLPGAFGGGGAKDKATLGRAIDVWRNVYVRPIEAAGGTVYTAKGNHDFTVRSSMKEEAGITYSGREAKRILTEGNERRGVVTNPNDPEACYYYVDNPSSKIRIIVADTTDSVMSARSYWAVESGMHEMQLKWLEIQAFGTIPEGWLAVVMHHIPVTGIVGSDGDVKTFAAFRKLLNKYSKKVILDLTGHHHCEMQTSQNGIWHVTNPCEAGYRDYINRSKPWCPNLPTKDAGTIYEQTFDAVQIDTERLLIHFTRVGGGGNRTLHCRPVKLSVGETHHFSSSLPGKVSWGCYDADRVDNKPDPSNRWMQLAIYHNDVAKISSNGILKTFKSGESVVVALAENGDKEMIPVDVGSRSVKRYEK